MRNMEAMLIQHYGNGTEENKKENNKLESNKKERLLKL